jgi:hypothetical protein
MANAIQITCASSTEYHQIDAVSQSRLKQFLRDPQLYYELYVARTRQPEPPTPAMQLGTDAETMIFYGTLPDSHVVIIPPDILSSGGKRQGKPWENWRDAQLAENPARQLLKQQEYTAKYEQLIAIQTSVYAHPKAHKLLDGAERHVAVLWTDDNTGMPCKAQFDLVKHLAPGVTAVPDLKTCRRSDIDGFTKAIWEHGYHLQATFYRRGWLELTGDDPLFAFIAVETKPSHACEVYDLDHDWYALAEPVLTGGMQRLAEAYSKDQWRRPTWGKVTPLKPAQWMRAKTEDQLNQWLDAE